MIGNYNFVSEAMDTLGVEPNTIRIKSSDTIVKRKIYQKTYHASEKQQKRRKLSDQVRAHNLGKIESNKNRHKSDKVKPGENVSTARKAARKSTGKKNSKKKKRKTKCGNCNQIGHNRAECQEPIITSNTPKTSSKTRSMIQNLF